MVKHFRLHGLFLIHQEIVMFKIFLHRQMIRNYQLTNLTELLKN